MTHTITPDQLIALNPCDLSDRLALFAGRESLTAAQALDAGATPADILWVAGRLGLKTECVRFAIGCAESVAPLNSDPRVGAAIQAAKDWLADPSDAAADAAYAAARAARAAAYAAGAAAYAAADAAYAAARAADTAYATARAAYAAAYAGMTEQAQRALILEIFG